MKKYFLIAIALVAILWSACNESPYINAPGDNRFNNPDISVLVPDTSGEVVSVEEAINIAKALKNNEETQQQYKLTGTISSPELQNQQLNFSLTEGNSTIKCQFMKNINNTPFRSQNQIPASGTTVTVQGKLTNYNGTTPEVKEGFIVRIHEQEEE